MEERRLSILDDVLGPVMRGPSSSHTAGPFFIGARVRALLGEGPTSVTVAFDPGGSFARVYQQQGSDAGFVAGLLGWSITDDRFHQALSAAAESGLRVTFSVEPLADASHPNSVEVRVTGESGRTLSVAARSIGGGAIAITAVNGRPEVAPAPMPEGDALFTSAAEMAALAEARAYSLGETALAYECQLRGVSEEQVLSEAMQRLAVMQAAIARGLSEAPLRMRTLHPSARAVFEAERNGKLAVGGPHARAAARALAVMHVNASGGVVCAAPTAGAAGVLPAVLATVTEERGLNPEQTARALLAAGAIGLIIARRATFAAETAGCQVEIGSATAMATAATVEAAGGSARQAANAAAIALHGAMGLVCDPVQGLVEIPCHSRNALGASQALVAADLILGGYANPIPLDETIDAVLAVGRMLPAELRCTALGGLAQTPAAQAFGAPRP